MTIGQNSLRRFLRRNDGIDFEVNDVAPVRDPLLEICDIGRLHQLETAFEFVINPTRNVLQSFRSQAATLMKAPVDWNRIAILKVFDNHVEQSSHLWVLLL